MNRRTRANFLRTFAAQPWTLFEDDPAAGGGGGTGNQGPQLNEHGYPDATPVANMAPEHQTAYWRYHSKKWETTAKAAPDATELETLRAAAAELATRKAAELTETERLQAEAAAARAEADSLRAAAAETAFELTKAQVAATKQLPAELAARLRGTTREELEADADSLLAVIQPAAPQTRGPQHQHGGSAPQPATNVADGAARYAARHGNN
jgi:hypothetical protein